MEKVAVPSESIVHDDKILLEPSSPPPNSIEHMATSTLVYTGDHNRSVFMNLPPFLVLIALCGG